MRTLLQQLYDEHRSIAAVLHGMQFLLREQRQRGVTMDPQVFRCMVYYLDVFPERCHHPKEDRYLFASVRERTREADDIIDQLEAEHERGAQAMRELEQALVRYEGGGEEEFAAFEAAVTRFVENYWAHMRREEQELMPIARRVLTADDWARIEAAFAETEDPLQGAADEADMRRLFSRIAEIAPEPIGMGKPL